MKKLILLACLGSSTCMNAQNIGIGTALPSEKLEIATGNLKLSASDKGIILNADDKPFITRGWDAFTGGIYAGLGRWGLFMESNRIKLGVPGIINRGFEVVSFDAASNPTNLLTVLANGNVGIGNTDPTYKFEVNGIIRSTSLSGSGTRDLRVDANGALTTSPVTTYVNVFSGEFHKTFPSTTSALNYTTGSDVALSINAGATDGVNAPVRFPHGATIINMKIWFWDNSINNLKIDLDFITLATVGPTSMATFTSGGATANYQSISIPVNMTVDNNLRLFQVKIGPAVGHTWDGSNLRIKGIVFEIQE